MRRPSGFRIALLSGGGFLILSLATPHGALAQPGAPDSTSVRPDTARAAPGSVRLAPSGGVPTSEMGYTLREPLFVPPLHRRLWLRSTREGGWIAQDKLLHFSLSYSGAFTLRASGASPGVALGTMAGAGVLKELHDLLLRPGGSPNQGISRRDLVADAAGLAMAGLAMHLWLR